MTASLVTGGAGFIGSHVARHLLSMGHDVVVLDDLSGGYRENVPAGAVFVRGSVTDVETVERLFRNRRFDYVYHLAAYAAEGLSHYIRRYNYTNNLIGSANLINAAVRHDVRCFVFASSIAVYGHAEPPVDEEALPAPCDPYGIAKYAVELDLAAAHEQFGLDYIVFRPHNVYGEGQNIGDPYRNVIGIFMRQVMAGEPMTVFGDGEQRRAFSYIDDVAPVIARSVDMPEAYNQTFNVGADVATSVNDLVAHVCLAMGVVPEIRRLPARNEVQHAYADHEKARRVFGLGEPVPLRDGLARMAEWARVAGARSSRKITVEVDKHMVEGWKTATQLSLT